MDGATIQTRINSGLAKASSFIGLSHNQYRPATISAPISSGNLLGTMLASFNIGGKYTGQNKQDQLFWQAILPRGSVQLGDYLVGTNTYCIVGMDALMPPIALRCTQTLTFSRANQDSAVGLQPYSDVNVSTIYAAGVPGAISQKKESGAPKAGLPGDDALRAFYSCNFYLPAGTVQNRDFVTDQDGNNYQVVSCNFCLLGWESLLEVVQA